MVLTELRIPANTGHPQPFAEVLSALPSPIIPNKMILAQHPEKEA